MYPLENNIIWYLLDFDTGSGDSVWFLGKPQKFKFKTVKIWVALREAGKKNGKSGQIDNKSIHPALVKTLSPGRTEENEVVLP